MPRMTLSSNRSNNASKTLRSVGIQVIGRRNVSLVVGDSAWVPTPRGTSLRQDLQDSQFIDRETRTLSETDRLGQLDEVRSFSRPSPFPLKRARIPCSLTIGRSRRFASRRRQVLRRLLMPRSRRGFRKCRASWSNHARAGRPRRRRQYRGRQP